MKRVMVVGAFTFIGYALVKRLLQEGIEVIGLGVEDLQHFSMWNEEKMLLIGRNASFTYHCVQERNEWNQEVDCIYICYLNSNDYDKTAIQSFLNLYESQSIRVILLSSIPSNKENEDLDNLSFATLEEKVATLPNYLILRVPAVYGPWQPRSMVFQQLLEAQLRQETIPVVKECMDDVIFVEDVAACLFQCSSSKECGTFHVESKEADAWEKGIRILGGTVELSEKGRYKREKCFDYEPMYTIEQGLQEQKHHILQYKYLYDLK
ncbi:NAD-dependent epimerase/dehydratase family protein [Ectobacillus sp. sgz5001026]|uniref:NAD-dependent epimerase/dehydratase family protein n=1 Tax=Ectobacillus sp. sgz5001026 TaxID=3242473 RepID=UPI0036D42F56